MSINDPVSFFMDEYFAQTIPHSEGARSFQGALILCLPSKWGNKIVLDSIESTIKNEGQGKNALTFLMTMADRHQVEITGFCKRIGTGGLTQRQLNAWYERAGFRVLEDFSIYRSPKP